MEKENIFYVINITQLFFERNVAKELDHKKGSLSAPFLFSVSILERDRCVDSRLRY